MAVTQQRNVGVDCSKNKRLRKILLDVWPSPFAAATSHYAFKLPDNMCVCMCVCVCVHVCVSCQIKLSLQNYQSLFS